MLSHCVRGETPQYNALEGGLSDIVDILVKKTKDYNVRTEDGATLGHAAVFGEERAGKINCLKSLAAQQKFSGWNICDNEGNTPIMLGKGAFNSLGKSRGGGFLSPDLNLFGPFLPDVHVP